MQLAFQKFKKFWHEPPPLQTSNYTQISIPQTDALQVGVGAVLSQGEDR